MIDIAIVGAGPAGSQAAFQLARSGAAVTLIDGSHPREKPCGGGVTRRALALVDASPETLGVAVPIDAARFEHERRQATVTLSRNASPGSMIVVSRRVFDGWLLQRAEEAGATVRRTRAVDLAHEGSGWRVRTRDGEVQARWVIGADGPGSLVRRRVLQPFERADLSVASGYYVHGVSSRRIDIAFQARPPGYLWSFPRHDHLAVGLCAQADVATSEQMLEGTARWLDRQVPGGTRERYSWPIPSLRATTLEREMPAGRGWMLAGDAAGLVDPITREGIYFALASGDCAATSLLEGRDPSGTYIERIRDTIHAELIVAARLKARFYRPQFMALLLSALQRSERIREIMADLVAGEQPYHSLRRRLLRTFELRLMLELSGLLPRQS